MLAEQRFEFECGVEERYEENEGQASLVDEAGEAEGGGTGLPACPLLAYNLVPPQLPTNRAGCAYAVDTGTDPTTFSEDVETICSEQAVHGTEVPPYR